MGEFPEPSQERPQLPVEPGEEKADAFVESLPEAQREVVASALGGLRRLRDGVKAGVYDENIESGMIQLIGSVAGTESGDYVNNIQALAHSLGYSTDPAGARSSYSEDGIEHRWGVEMTPHLSDYNRLRLSLLVLTSPTPAYGPDKNETKVANFVGRVTPSPS